MKLGLRWRPDGVALVLWIRDDASSYGGCGRRRKRGGVWRLGGRDQGIPVAGEVWGQFGESRHSR